MICASSESCPDEGWSEWNGFDPVPRICQSGDAVNNLRQCHPDEIRSIDKQHSIARRGKQVEVYHQNPAAQTKQHCRHRRTTVLCEVMVPDGNAENVRPRIPPAPLKQTWLLNPCATALNQDDQHDNKKHPGSNPDNRGTVHIDSLPS
jgi:hypothetical protein